MNYQLKTRQVCLLIIAFTPIVKLFSMPSILANTANEDMWISCLISVLLDFLTVLLVIYACRKANAGFFELLENRLSKPVSTIILVLFLIYFSMKAIIPISEQREYVELTLYTLKPNLLYFMPFFVAAFYICIKPLRVLGRAADVAWFFTLAGFLILLSLSLSNIDFYALLPIGASGSAKILTASYKSFNWFGDAAYLLFLVGEFSYKKKDGLKIALSYLISSIIVITFMVIFYSIFTSIAHRQRFAFTEISKYTTVINNLGRFDYIGIVLLLFSNAISLTLPLFFCTEILIKIFNFKKRIIPAAIVILLQLAVVIFLKRFYYGIEKFITEYAGVFFFVMGNLLPALSPLITIKKEKVYANS